MSQSAKRERWSSWLSFIWVASGAAVGLGNVWKFPYMAGSHGGSAFVLMYLFFVLLIAMPLMAAEIMLGKLSQRNAVDSFVYLAKLHSLSQNWRFTGYLGLLTLFLVFCFYSVVAGFSLIYLFFALTNRFSGLSSGDIQALWLNFLAQPMALITGAVLFIISTMTIIYFGIKRGIERACSLMMPALLLVLVVLVVYSSTSSGFAQALSFLFAFEPDKLKASIIISSLGHAFFTLAVGACAMMVYGSHLPDKVSVLKSVFWVALLDVIVALLSGLAIFPLIFEQGLSPAQGPGLMFISLPMVFTTMSGAWLWASLFFILLFFAALSSALSFAEPLVDVLIAKISFKRSYATVLVGILVLIGSIICALSFNLWSYIKIAGRFSIFDVVADLATNLLLPIGAILIALFSAMVIKPKNRWIFYLWRILMMFIVPLAIVVVMLHALIDLLY